MFALCVFEILFYFIFNIYYYINIYFQGVILSFYKNLSEVWPNFSLGIPFFLPFLKNIAVVRAIFEFYESRELNMLLINKNKRSEFEIYLFLCQAYSTVWQMYEKHWLSGVSNVYSSTTNGKCGVELVGCQYLIILFYLKRCLMWGINFV